MRKWKLAIALVVWMLVAAAAPGQEARTCRVERASTPPKLDGALDAPCWKGASWQTGFTLLDNGRRAEEQTEFAMLWDDKFLYIGVRVREPAMDAVHADAADKDQAVFKDDHVEIFLRSEVDRKISHQLGVNPAGARAETARSGVAAVADLPWRCAAKRLAESWQVEIAVPLTMFPLQPREGAAVFGNVARVRLAGGAKINSTWSPLQGTFFAPEMFGKMTLTVPGKPELMPARLDVVSMQNGDRLAGTALGMMENEKGAATSARSPAHGALPKWLRFQGAAFVEPVGVDLSQVTRIESKNLQPPTPKGSRIALTNGDYVIGDVKTINAEKADLVSSTGDPMTFPVAILAAVTLGKLESDYIDTTFDTDDLSPWVAVRGHWDVSNGKLQLTRISGGAALLAAPLRQKGSVTFVADLEALGSDPLMNCEMIVFGSSLSKQDAMSGLLLNWSGQSYHLSVVQPGGGRQVITFQPVSERTPRVRLRLAYDPTAGQGRFWVNDTGAGMSFKVPNGPKTGTHVALRAYREMAVQRLIAQSGILEPGDARETVPADGVLINMANGDSVTARSVQLDAGRVTIKTAFGDLTPEPGGVSEIRFLRKAKPSPPAKFVRVQAADCRLTFDSCEVFEDRLVGHSEQYGAVRIQRGSVFWIQFERGAK